MEKRVTCFLLVLLICSLTAAIGCGGDDLEETVEFRDSRLEEAIREETGIKEEEITRGDLEDILGLEVHGTVRDLEGLQYAGSMENLALHDLHVANLEPLADLVELEELVIILEEEGVDLTPLSELSDLHSLLIVAPGTRDFSALDSLVELEKLQLMSTRLEDISFVNRLDNLRDLYIISEPLTDITPVSGLPELESLRVKTSDLGDITAVEELNRLKRLELYGSELEDISAVSHLKNLEHLTLGGKTLYHTDYPGNNRVRDISVLENLEALQELHLYSEQVDDISALEGMQELRRLHLETPLDREEISLLEELPSLQEAAIAVDTGVTTSDIAGLEDRGIETDIRMGEK